jgi:hypothetical protein
MAKPKTPRVILKMQRVAEGDWQMEVHYPGADIRYMPTFGTLRAQEQS